MVLGPGHGGSADTEHGPVTELRHVGAEHAGDGEAVHRFPLGATSTRHLRATVDRAVTGAGRRPRPPQERRRTTTPALAPRPTVWARPTRAPWTWRPPASPRS